MEHILRVFDFNVYNESPSNDSGSEDDKKSRKYNAEFIIQMFGLNEEGETCSIQVEEFKPFFYVMVNDEWNTSTKNSFLAF